MTKTEIIQKLASENDCTQKVAGGILQSFQDVIGDELKKGNSVTLMGFGKFSASFVKGRDGKNPRNPEETMKIPDSMRIYFSAGQGLKDKVNESLKKKASKPVAKKSSDKKAAVKKTGKKKK